MPVEGPLAFRANSWKGGKEVVSPAWPFAWDGPVVWAECASCPKDEDGHIVPGFNHTCGIWATLDKKVVDLYVRDAGGVMYLVEAIGDYVLHESGWRAGGAQVVGIVNTSFLAGEDAVTKIAEQEETFDIRVSPVALSIQAACDKYRVPLIQYPTALEMAKIVWAREGMPWPL